MEEMFGSSQGGCAPSPQTCPHPPHRASRTTRQKTRSRLAKNDRRDRRAGLEGTSPGQSGVEMPHLVRPIAFAILLASLSAASAEPAFEAKAICRAAMASITARDLKLFQAADAPDGTIAL